MIERIVEGFDGAVVSAFVRDYNTSERLEIIAGMSDDEIDSLFLGVAVYEPEKMNMLEAEIKMETQL